MSPAANAMIEAGTPVLATRYHLRSLVGRGGAGQVWRAYDELLDREVAIKQATCAHGTPDRSLREARAAARVNCAGAVTVYDHIVEDGRPWIVMELIRGHSLQEMVDRHGPLPPRRVAEIGCEVLATLRATHATGIIHCDVKPSNILLTADRVVLTDFGLAVRKDRRAVPAPCEGSPPYISPEQAAGQRITEASDLWALGATLYAAVEGKSPFQRAEPLASLIAVLTEKPRPSAAAGPLTHVIELLLRKDPADRAAADDAARLLDDIRTDRPHRRRRFLKH